MDLVHADSELTVRSQGVLAVQHVQYRAADVLSLRGLPDELVPGLELDSLVDVSERTDHCGQQLTPTSYLDVCSK